MDCARARAELGWEPRRTATEVLQEFLDGLQKGGGMETEPMRGRKVG